MIDSINHRIISALKNDGRCSNASLAKELGLNAATVKKRMEKMLSESVINIRAILNPYKLGYTTHAVIALDVDLSRVDKICGQLISSHNTSLVVTTFGRYDVILLADFPTWEMLQDYIAKGLPKIKGILKIDAFPIIENKKTLNPLFNFESSLSKPASIDEIDRNIIEELEKDGRLNYTELAKQLGISLATVSRRVARLKEEEIIKILAIRNPSKMGYMASAYTLLHADLNKVDGICSKLRACPEVHLIMTVMSGFEVLVGIHLENPEMLYKFIVNTISGINGVSNVETFVCAEIKKRSYPLFYLDNAA